MSVTISGVVPNGVVVSHTALPGGARVEIHGQSARQFRQSLQFAPGATTGKLF
jgi:hypothetical protein